MEETIIDDEKEDIQVLRIKFASGKKIEALSSKPASIRGRQGSIILDEAGFYETSLSEYLKATLAMQIWGSKVILLSTHNGENNEFNKLCEDIKNGKEPFYLQRTTFRQAVEHGLYNRVCLATGNDWTEENETVWVKDIYDQYGDRATEELDAIPQSSNPHAIFKPEMFRRVAKADLPSGWDVLGYFFDMAATDNKNSCYTSGVLMGIKGNRKYILNWVYCKKNPGASEDFFFDVVKRQGKNSIVAFEQEGGSQALRYVEHIKRALPGFTVKAIKPSGNKLLRSLPVKESAKNGEYFILDEGEEWTDDFIKTICQFDGTPGVPLVTDLADSLSGAHETFTKKINYLLNS
jgi:predicted phage terminase large subunit-like protein